MKATPGAPGRPSPASAAAKRKATAEGGSKHRSLFLADHQWEAEEAARIQAEAEAAEAAAALEDKTNKLPTPPPEDSEEEELAGKPVPATGKLFLLPRDARRMLEIEVEAEGKKVAVRPIGPDFGDSTGKFVSCARSRVGSNFYSVPYCHSRVLVIDPITSRSFEIGPRIRGDDNKYTCCVSCVNWHGRMYAAPCKAQRVLEIDPSTGSVKEVGPKLGELGVSKWYAIASTTMEMGRIYAIPFDARRVLMIDPTRGGMAREIGPDLGPMKAKYKSVAVASTGDLYCAPLNAPRVLRITAAGEVSLVGPDLGVTERKYACIIAAPNKLLYAPPLFADRVLEIRTTQAEVREIGGFLGSGEGKYACGAVGCNGKIYCPPLAARRVLEINCEDHETHEIGMDIGAGDEKYSSIAASPAGNKLFAAPREARKILEIEPALSSVREIGMDLGSMRRKYTCIVPGLTYKELVEGGKVSIEYASRALSRAERSERQAQRELALAEFALNGGEAKFKHFEPMADEAATDAAAAQAELEESAKHRTEGQAEASRWITAKDSAKIVAERAAIAEERLSRAREDLESVQVSFQRQTIKLKEMQTALEKAQTDLERCTEDTKSAVELEKEARRQHEEARIVTTEKRKY